MVIETDIAIIGGGTAGLTAAIAAQNAGMQSVVLERQTGVGDSAGESMHPGLATIARQLGLLPDFERAATGRYPGILIRNGRHDEHFESFGQTNGVPWLGYHIPRHRLAKLLWERASLLGSTIRLGCKVAEIDFSEGTNTVLTTASGEVRAKWVLDASGPYGFSARRDQTGYHRSTPSRTVAYSYERQQVETDQTSLTPVLQIEPWGWEWKAPLGNGFIACVALYKSAQVKAEQRQNHAQNVRYADGTWVVAKQPSQSKVFRIGDAALRFDPSSGKGVLRAMMTAMMAVHLIDKVSCKSVADFESVSFYNGWIQRWFRHDAEMLSRSKLAS